MAPFYPNVIPAKHENSYVATYMSFDIFSNGRNGHRGWMARCDDNFFFSFSFDLESRYIDYIIYRLLLLQGANIYILREFLLIFFLAISGEEIGKVYQNIINQID